MKVAQCVNTSVYSHSHYLWLAVSFKCLQVDFSQCTTFLLWARILTNCVGIIHGAQSLVCFTPETAQFLVHGTILKRQEEEMLGAIPDADIQGKLQKVRMYVVSESAISARYVHV